MPSKKLESAGPNILCPTLQDWLGARGIARITVISPHLDDAVYSLAAFLGLPGLPELQVLTVFTEAGSATDPAHAHAAGFSDPVAEHASRRREDARAMARLGLKYLHCGVESGRTDFGVAASLAAEISQWEDPTRHLVLLPLGAGGILSAGRRQLRRLLRRPPGAPPHGEHLLVRDQMHDYLTPIGVPLGYYAEIPYQWANSPSELSTLARQLVPNSVREFVHKPDPAEKLIIAREYTSQIAPILGHRVGYQRRVVSIPERLFLPE